MKLQLTKLGDTKLFTAHGEGFVTVNGESFKQNIVVMAEAVHSDWSAQSFEQLNEADFDYFVKMKPDVLLLGTGSKQRFAHPKLFRNLTQAGIGVECMDTAAACRTYNILVAEDRKVIAAILI